MSTKIAIESKYEILQTLGTGAFSEVKLAIHRQSRQRYAVKIIDRKKCLGKENMIHSEISILKKVRHDNIVQLYELFETDQKIYLVMELVTGGELFDSIVARGHYTEADAARIIEKILCAVDYLHSLGIAHRDLKPENLLFYSKEANAKIMISDFGLSKIFNDENVTMMTACGTPGYVAPEVLKRIGYGKEVDIWSLGVIAYILLCGYPPFYHEKNQELFQLIIKGKYEFDSPHWDDISKEAKDLISKMMVVDPKKRLTTSEALNHPFILRYCSQNNNASKKEKNKLFQKSYIASKEVKGKSSMQAPEKNLAHTISENMRATLTSSRRSSMDRQSLKGSNQPTAVVPQIQTVPENVKEANTDSHQSKEKDKSKKDIVVPTFDPESNKDFISNISKLNKLIEDNELISAEMFLEDMDCPPRMRELYNKVILNNPEYKKQLKRRKEAQKRESNEEPNASNLLHSMLETLNLKSSVNRNGKTVTSPQETPIASQELHKTVIREPTDATIYQESSIKILSLDLNLKPPGIKANVSDFKDDRLEYFCNNILPNYDVICLQEFFAFGSRRRDKLLTKASQLGFKSWVCSPGKALFDGAQIDGGLVLLSRYPIVKSARMAFERGAYSDRLVSKGAIYAAIQVPSTTSGVPCFIHVFNTDLQSCFDHEQFHSYNPEEIANSVRRRQFVELKRFVGKQLEMNLTFFSRSQGSHDPVFLMGNFHLNGRRGVLDGKFHGEEYLVLKSVLDCADSDASTQSNIKTFFSDLVYAQLGEHPITLGNVSDFDTMTPKETVLSSKKFASICACTSYVFEIRARTSSCSQVNSSIDNSESRWRFENGSVKVEKFLTDEDDVRASKDSGIQSDSLAAHLQDRRKTSADILMMPLDTSSGICEPQPGTLGDSNSAKYKFTQISDNYGISFRAKYSQ